MFTFLAEVTGNNIETSGSKPSVCGIVTSVVLAQSPEFGPMREENILRGLIVPGLNGSGSAHWQTLWEHKYKFERVEQLDWGNPDAVSWTEKLDTAIRMHSDNIVLIAHSLGMLACNPLGCFTPRQWG